MEAEGPNCSPQLPRGTQALLWLIPLWPETCSWGVPKDLNTPPWDPPHHPNSAPWALYYVSPYVPIYHVSLAPQLSPWQVMAQDAALVTKHFTDGSQHSPESPTGAGWE